MRFRKVFTVLAATMALGVQAQELQVKVNEKGKLGYVDASGNEVIPCKYESAGPFKQGLAIVGKGSKYGMVDATGKVVVPIKYRDISIWSDHVYKVSTGKTYGLLNEKGEFILEPEYFHISSLNCYGKALIALGGSVKEGKDKQRYLDNSKLGIVNADGKVLIQPSYKGLYEFAYDPAAIPAIVEGKAMLPKYYSLTDTLLTDCKYVGFSKKEGTDAESGIFDENGQVLVAPGVYTYLMRPSNGMVRFYNSNKSSVLCGYYNLETKKAFEVGLYKSSLKDITSWTHGDFLGAIAPVNGDSWHFVDREGKTVRSGYEQVLHSRALGLWTAITAEGKCDVFDEDGNDQTALCGFESVCFPQIKEDQMVFTAKKNGKWGVVDPTGKELVSFQYENAYPVYNGMVAVQNNQKWGIIDGQGNELMPIEHGNLFFGWDTTSRDLWVKNDSNFFQHYNLDTKKLSSLRFKEVSPFYKGLGLGVPESLFVANTPVNRAQLFLPGTDMKEVNNANPADNKVQFGYLVNSNGEYVSKYPISALYYERVIEAIHALKVVPNEHVVKSILLDVTKANRTYPLDAVLGEEEWDY